MRSALLHATYLFVVAAISGCSPSGATTTGQSDLTSDAGALAPLAVTTATAGLPISVHTTLGFPEAASTTDPAHLLLVKPQFVTSFDSTKKNPRWTSWEVTSQWLGHTGRTRQDFSPDRMVPRGTPQASMTDYVKSGFDRGHICPSADRTDNAIDNTATFVFTNCVPQTTASNTGTWETLEREERSLADQGHKVFVVAGSLYEGAPQTIGRGVAVPSSMFKIVVVLDGDAPTPASVTPATRVIAVDIPNTTTVTGDFRGYRTTMAALEAKTGFAFLSNVDKSVHDALAPVVDTQ